ncbi:MAG: hypothetical protein WC655_17370 [Candidatus Hydrogenedentales bacterium]|jgi:hypothetical protein
MSTRHLTFGLLGVALLASMAAGAAEQTSVTETNLAPLPIDLPEAYFGGTPIIYVSPNFEEPVYTQRAPFMAPQGAVNLAKGKPVTSSDANPRLGNLSFLTDQEKDYHNEFLLELGTGVQWIQIDLGETAELFAVLAWHFHMGDRVYFDVVVQVSDDPSFAKGVTTLYNNDIDNSAGLGVGADTEYIENYQGRLIDAKGVKGRYVRLYSNGNTTDDTNNYVEVEVFGRPREG